MKATLEFMLPEEEIEHHDAINGTGYRSAYRAVLEQIRTWKKHGHRFTDPEAVLNLLYDEMLEQINIRRLDVYNP
jgi:hypothetical protein